MKASISKASEVLKYKRRRYAVGLIKSQEMMTDKLHFCHVGSVNQMVSSYNQFQHKCRERLASGEVYSLCLLDLSSPPTMGDTEELVKDLLRAVS